MRKRIERRAGLGLGLAFTLILGGAMCRAETPGREWSRFWGTWNAEGTAVCADTNGNLYAVGYNDMNLEGLTNASAPAEMEDIFLTKFDPDGNRLMTLLWGSVSNDEANAVAVDSSGAIYVAGTTWGSIDGQSPQGHADAFLTKLNAAGVRQWTRIWGSASNDYAYGLALDRSNRVFVVGTTWGGFGGQTNAGKSDMLMSAFNTSGSNLWHRIWGSPKEEELHGVCVGSTGDVFAVGWTYGSFGAETNHGDSDMYATRFLADGTRNGEKLWGSPTADKAFAICTVGSNFWVAGHTYGAFDGQTNAGSTDFCLTLLDSQGSSLWTRIWGSTNYDTAAGLAVDKDGNAFVAGYAEGAVDGQPPVWNNDGNLYLGKTDRNGTRLWSQLWRSTNSSGPASAESVCLGLSNAVYVAGRVNDYFDGEGPGYGASRYACLSKYVPDYRPNLTVALQGNRDVAVAWRGAYNLNFDLRTCTNLPATGGNWVALPGATNLPGEQYMGATNAPAGAVRFYQVKAHGP